MSRHKRPPPPGRRVRRGASAAFGAALALFAITRTPEPEPDIDLQPVDSGEFESIKGGWEVTRRPVELSRGTPRLQADIEVARPEPKVINVEPEPEPATEVEVELEPEREPTTEVEVATAAPEHKHYNVGPVKPHVQVAADEIGTLFGVTSIGGVAARSNPDSDHPKGLALDFMVGAPTGDALAAYVIEHYERLRVSYVIWSQSIWSVQRSSEGWRWMTSRGSITADHYDHVHVSFYP